MNTPIDLNDDEVAAVAGGLILPVVPLVSITNSVNNNLASFAVNSNNNSFNHSFNTILSNNTISL